MKGTLALKIAIIMMGVQLLQAKHYSNTQNMDDYKSSTMNIVSIPGEVLRIKAIGVFYADSIKAESIANAVVINHNATNETINILFQSNKNALAKKESSECHAQEILNAGPNHGSTAAEIATAATKVGAELGTANALIAAQDVEAAALLAAQIGTAASIKAANAVKAAALKTQQITDAATKAASYNAGKTQEQIDAEYIRAANQVASEDRLAGDLYASEVNAAADLSFTQIKAAANLKGGYICSAAELKANHCINAAQLIAGVQLTTWIDITRLSHKFNFIVVDFSVEKMGLMYIGVGSAFSRTPTANQLRRGVDGNGQRLFSVSSLYTKSNYFTKKLQGNSINSENSYKVYYFVRTSHGESKVKTIKFEA